MLHPLPLPALRQTHDRPVAYSWRICLPAGLQTPEGSFREPRKAQEHVTPSKPYGSAGILTCCPSTTPFGLALGPTNPGAIRVALETLGLWWTGFSPVFLLLMPTFSLRNAPRWLTLPLHCNCECSLTDTPSRRTIVSRDFGTTLSPDKFSVRKGWTSELLRFL